MVPYVQDMPRARCVALTQEHRGHGVSTAAYYLGRVLVSQGLRVLLIEATGRRARLQSLIAQNPVKNLVLWTPHVAQPQDLQPALERARRETAGRADVLLLDIDAALLEHAKGLELGIDYVAAITEPTAAGQAAADHIAEHLHDAQPPHGRVGVVFSRVDAPSAGDLPERTEHRHLPVIGYYPADYLLAGGDAYSLKGGDSSYPHDTYLYALLRLGQKLAQIVPLERVPRCAPVDQCVPPTESNEQQLA
ncbi:MAG TPA: hypothetical protein VF510_05005 [Ktedonobacterales bacterium]